MQSKLRILAAAAALLFSLLACNLPTRGQPAPTATPQATALPTSVPSTPTASGAADPNLPGAVLTLADLPAGFSELSTADFQQLGVDESIITSAFGDVLQNAEVQSLKGFINRQNFEVLVCFVMAPLTLLERTAFDVYLSNPQNVIQRIGSAGNQNDAAVIAGMDGIGDASVGVTFTSGSSPNLARGDVSISRRGSAVTACMVFYVDGSTPLFTLQQAASLMDGRVAAALQ